MTSGTESPTTTITLRRETLRTLTPTELRQAAGGWTRTRNCTGDRTQAGATGGC